MLEIIVNRVVIVQDHQEVEEGTQEGMVAMEEVEVIQVIYLVFFFVFKDELCYFRINCFFHLWQNFLEKNTSLSGSKLHFL